MQGEPQKHCSSDKELLWFRTRNVADELEGEEDTEAEAEGDAQEADAMALGAWQHRISDPS